ncbi:MAG: hypothetical protein CM15mP129_10650 [Chloroflexota bacterium]|nr:MAG: hypothetical protein CM15mP129_10650 [Chloroflexota bacterium]
MGSPNCFKDLLFFISVMLDNIENTPPSGSLVAVDCQIVPSKKGGVSLGKTPLNFFRLSIAFL